MRDLVTGERVTGELLPGELLMGVDVGTTRVKAVVHTVDGVEVASASASTPWQHDGEGTQMDAEALSRVVRGVTGRAGEQALATRSGARIAGIGVTGMGEAGVLTGADGSPLAPVRAWHDRRGDVSKVRAAFGDAAFQRATGMPLNAQPSLPKILTLQGEFPGALAAQRFWSVPEWAVRCLGGAPGSELSLASRTGLLDVVAARPWDLAAALVGADLLGPLVAAGTAAGVATGVDVHPALHGAVLTVAGHDHQTAALAAGAVHDGVLFDSVGTAEALLRFTLAPVFAQDVERLAGQGITVGLTVVPGHYCVLAGLLVGLGLERISTLLQATSREDRAALGSAALSVDPLPGAAHVAMIGDSVQVRLDAELTPAQLWARAVQDLVGAADDSIAKMRAVFGAESAVIVTGGWLANPAVLAAKRRQFPDLVLSGLSEAGAVGAGRLAAVAAGLLDRPDPTGASHAPPLLPGPSSRTDRQVSNSTSSDSPLSRSTGEPTKEVLR